MTETFDVYVAKHFEPNDRVRHADGYGSYTDGTVLAVDGNDIWVRLDGLSQPQTLHSTRLTKLADNSADLCRQNGWNVGTQLTGDEGYGPTVIEITAIGETRILAKTISHNGYDPPNETSWDLMHRNWKVHQ